MNITSEALLKEFPDLSDWMLNNDRHTDEVVNARPRDAIDMLKEDLHYMREDAEEAREEVQRLTKRLKIAEDCATVLGDERDDLRDELDKIEEDRKAAVAKLRGVGSKRRRV